jgi:phosphatidylglycerophosphate synthase
MTLLQQYNQSLKAPEAEEILDLLIYRPVAFLFVKVVYHTNLTPNQISSLAMLVGVLAGMSFGFGSYSYLVLGGVLYFTCNVLDCADGQIARLKGTGTKTGRIIDGFIDYVVSVAVFAGIGIALADQWLLTVAAGLSSALQSFLFDSHRNKYLEIVYGKILSLKAEIAEFSEEQNRIKSLPNKGLDRFLIAIYLVYSRLQLKLQPGTSSRSQTPFGNEGIASAASAAEYAKNNKFLLRLWSFAGSTTHITVCIICAFINNLELFLWFCVLPLNILIIILYAAQRFVGTPKRDIR